LEDIDQHSVQIVSDIQNVNAQRRDALVLHPPVPSCIALRVVAELVRETINFDGEQSQMTVEVQYIWTSRMLASEFEAVWATTENVPKRSLWRAQ